ncbi:3-oxoacyl-(acyl-carrier-protein) reductase [Hyphomicrobiales bacterium]|nr:3-oxoacyl-(acyl-carrier-protein) reductase [Hyphomicrobiales bacterium]CAH1691520.1 3-oxoacyl-(acyl-carrier-protein) reductase [Hyphomicrobiales bacterium]
MTETNITRVALVTGGAQGVGRAIARKLLEQGAEVVIADIQEEKAKEAAAEITADGGVALGLAADVASEESVRQLFATVDEQFGRLDILVNNAGIAPRRMSEKDDVEGTALDDWQRVIAINLTGVFLMCRAAVPLMKRGGWGRIVNIASRAGRTHSPTTRAHYAASKAGLIGFSRALAGEVGAAGITVNCVSPARVVTPLTRNAGDVADEDLRTIARTPVGRVGRPEDIAAAVAFLASDGAAFTSGAILDVTGGAYMP